VIAAHPDDEVLGMGGTIRKYARTGHVVKVILMATGIVSRRSVNYKNSTDYKINNKIRQNMKKQVAELQKDARRACAIMGVKDVEFMDFPDNEMDKISNLEITKKIESVIKKFEPEVVFTHSHHDINVDHRALYYATITATRPSKDSKIKQVISFEVPSSTEWYFPYGFSPNIFVDITNELPIKLKALKAYRKEIREFPHPRSIEALEAIAKKWGSVAGFKAAEAFSLVRDLRKDL
jgi:LmbE family N-acetylglucosaminyl deacetylase